jgi:bifunctional DNA-binding transcriptional regulator/antitoxin component of YhaV-PrlF toxin-antitoxin module
MRASVSEKGQVTLPKPLREKLGIRPGDVIHWAIDECGHLVGVKEQDIEAEIRSVSGTLKLGMTVDEWLEELRGPRDLA